MNFRKHGKLKIILGILVFIVIVITALSLSNEGSDENKAANTDTVKIKEPKKAVANDTVFNTSGSTSGNLNNTGRFTIQGDWIYYTDDENIYKIKSDGSGKTTLVSHNAGKINVVGNWLYYVTNFDEGDLICKIKIDGSDTGKVLFGDDEPKEEIQYLIVVGNWIYYQQYRNGKLSFNKMKTDGSQKTVLLKDMAIAKVDGDWIYYTKSYGKYANGSLYKMRTDGSENTKLMDLENVSLRLDISNGWIYYINNIPSGDTIYKVKTDGSQKTKLASKEKKQYVNEYNYINVSGDWIYYSDVDCNMGSGSKTLAVSTISKMKTDGSQNTKLIEENDGKYSYGPISVVGDWIYYHGQFDERHSKWILHKVKTDGSQESEVQ